MNLTNRLNLPQPLVDAVKNDHYDGAGASDYTTTGLLRPARLAALLGRHSGTLEEDVSERIWALMGQVVHGIIERAATEELVEKRFFMEIGGKTVSGQVDLWHGLTLWDWKLTSVYTGKDGAKQEWIEQANINRLLCHRNGVDVKAAQYVALYRDWSKMAVERKGDDYPQQQVEIFDIPLWPLGVTEQFVLSRIEAHEAAKVELPLCSAEERWMRPEKWALMKKGQKRAVKLYDSEERAEDAAADSMNAKFYVEHRPGQNIRCEFYCPVSGHCQQFRDLVQP